MDIKKNMDLFREFIKQNRKYALIYSNSTSSFAEKNFREQVFKIKSDLAHDVVKDNKLYLSINLWRTITRIFTDYVIGNGFVADYNNDEFNKVFVQTSDEVELQTSLDGAITNQSCIWYGLLRLRKDDEGQIKVDVIPLPNYCANMEWLGIGDWFLDIREHFIFSIQRNKQTGKRYFYVDRYEKQEDGEWRWFYGEQREYNSNFILSKRIKEWEEEPLDFMPLYLFNNDLDDPHVASDEGDDVKNKSTVWDIPRYFHQSDYRDIIDILQEINDRESQISVEFIKNLTSKLSVPAWFASAQVAKKLKDKKEGKLMSENPDYLVHNPWEQPAQYIVKDATYIQATINDYMPMLFKLLTCLTTVPAILLSNAIYGGNTPVGTTDKEFEPFYKRVGKKQQLIYSSLQRLFRDILVLKWYKNVPLPTIKFIKPTANDIATKATTAIQLVNAGIMSKESALSFIMWYDDIEVKEEMDKIAQEEKDSYAKYQAFNLNSNDKNEWTNNEEES